MKQLRLLGVLFPNSLTIRRGYYSSYSCMQTLAVHNCPGRLSLLFLCDMTATEWSEQEKAVMELGQ